MSTGEIFFLKFEIFFLELRLLRFSRSSFKINYLEITNDELSNDILSDFSLLLSCHFLNTYGLRNHKTCIYLCAIKCHSLPVPMYSFVIWGVLGIAQAWFEGHLWFYFHFHFTNVDFYSSIVKKCYNFSRNKSALYVV